MPRGYWLALASPQEGDADPVDSQKQERLPISLSELTTTFPLPSFRRKPKSRGERHKLACPRIVSVESRCTDSVRRFTFSTVPSMPTTLTCRPAGIQPAARQTLSSTLMLPRPLTMGVSRVKRRPR
jgi:hypothetical protein